MASYETNFDVADSKTIELPQHLLATGGKYTVDVADGGVTIWGNELGLLYLAEVLIRCAKGGYVPTLHVHLPLDTSMSSGGPNVTAEPELTVFAADPRFEAGKK